MKRGQLSTIVFALVITAASWSCQLGGQDTGAVATTPATFASERAPSPMAAESDAYSCTADAAAAEPIERPRLQLARQCSDAP